MWNLKPYRWTFHILFVKLGGTVQKTTFISNTSCKVQVVPKTTLRFDNSLGGLRTHWMVYYNERIQIKTSQRKTCIGQSSKPGVSLVLSLWSHGRCYFPDSGVWQFAWSIANHRSSTEPWCPEMFLGLCSWLREWMTFHLQPLSGRADTFSFHRLLEVEQILCGQR